MRSPINIANYEEFFLLYVDGELSAAEQQAVEQFVQENPHLAEELDMLMQMKLPAEEMVFADKEILFRNGSSEISPENYETHFLLYVDNELDAAGKTAVETFVLQHPSLQDQFMLLKKTRLEPETIVFPDKASLYRKEEKERRVIYMSWQRIAVAAALIGVIALVWTLVPSTTTTDPKATVYMPAPGKAAGPERIVNEPGTTVHQEPDRALTAGKTIPVRNSQGQHVPLQALQTPAENLVLKNTGANTVINETPPATVTARVDATQPIVTPVTAGATGVVENPPAEITTVKNNSVTPDKNLVNTINHPSENTAAVAQPAVYKELDTDAEDNKKSLYVGSLEINKDKLRGFFRKASSLFRGKAKQQEEERSENAPSSSNTRSLR